MAEAPIIYFDRIQTLGSRDGVAHLSLSARLYDPDKTATGGVDVHDDVVANLRFPIALLDGLKRALDDIKLTAQPAAGAGQH